MSVDVTDNLAALVAGLETMIYGFEDTVQPIVDAAKAHTHEQLDGVQSVLVEPITQALAAADVNLPFEGGGPLDWSAAEGIVQQLSLAIDGHTDTVDGVTSAAVAHVDAMIGNVTGSISDLIIGVLRGLGDLVGGLLGNLAESPEVWTDLYTTLRDAFGRDKDPITQFTADIGGAIAHKLGDVLGQSLNGYKIIGNAVMTGNEVHALNPDELAARMDAWPDWLKSIVDISLEFVSAWGILSALGSTKVDEAAQAARKENPIVPLSPSQLIELSRRQYVGYDWARDHAKRSGVSGELFDIAYKLSQSYLTAGNYIDLWRRTGDDSVLDNLRVLGLSDDDIGNLRTLATAVPTPTDLVRFMVRDVFDDTAIIAGKLDDQFTDKINLEAFRVSGVSVDTMKLYWMSHWQLPSPGMLYEMFHRGFIQESEMIEALKVADYAPGWIDNLVKINYNVPGRIDIRRMYEAGVITTHEELVKRHQDMGYSPADAETLAQFVEALHKKTQDAETERLHGPIAAEIIRSYATGGLDYDKAHDDLTGLGYADDMATFRLQLGIFERERDRANRIRTSVGREYVKGFIDESEARSRLEAHGFEANEQDSLLDSWNLDRELAEMSDEKRHQRDLSKSEIIESYRDGVLDAGQARSALISLGYDEQESGTLLALEDQRTARADAKLVESAVRTQFITRRIEAAQASDTLAGFGYSHDRIAALMTRWEVDREERRPDISASTLERAIMLGAIPQDEAEKRLKARGYTDGDVSLWLTLWRTQVATNDATLQERIREFDQREARLRTEGTRRLDLTERSQNLTQTRFTESQSAVAARFTASQAQQATLQTQRLTASLTRQNASIAATTARDAANFAARRTQQATQIAAADARLAKQIDAQTARQNQAIAARQQIEQQQATLRQQAVAAQDARASAQIQAQAARLDQQIKAQNDRAASAQATQARLQAQRLDAQTTLTKLRADIQSARDIQVQANKITDESRQEQIRVRTEQRAQARKDITTSSAAQSASALQSLQLQQTAAVADITSRFATLQAALADERRQTALALQQAATAALAASTPAASLLDTNV